jgi:hypothetical protein
LEFIGCLLSRLAGEVDSRTTRPAARFTRLRLNALTRPIRTPKPADPPTFARREVSRESLHHANIRAESAHRLAHLHPVRIPDIQRLTRNFFHSESDFSIVE